MFTWLDEQAARKFEDEETRLEGRITESVSIYRDEMNLDNDSVIAKIKDKFGLSQEAAEQYVLGAK